MEGVQLSLVLSVHLPPGTPEPEMQDAFRTCWEPLVLALNAQDSLSLGLALSGPTLDWLERTHPPFLESLRSLVRAERVELLTCGWGHAFLSGLNERDALGQLRLHMQALRLRLGARVKGAAPAEGVWGAELVGAMAQAELSYALLDERVLEPGETPAAATGWHVTESEGHALRLLPATGTLRKVLGGPSPAELVRNLARRAKAGGGPIIVQDNALRLGQAVSPGRLTAWLVGLGRLVTEQAHWLRTQTPGAALARLPCRGRAYPSAWVPPHVARWTLGPAQALRLVQYQRASAQNPVARRGPPFARSAAWQESLARYEEANRLHKHAAMVSKELQRLRRALESDSPDPQHLRERLAALQQGERMLYEAQVSDPLWHGPTGGVYESRSRAAAWSTLAELEALLRKALNDPARVTHALGDFDGDTRDEVLVRTPLLSATVDPEAGGALSTLLFYELPGNVLNTMTRRTESLHEGLARFSTLPSVVDGEDQVAASPPGLPRLDDEAETELEIGTVPEGKEGEAPLAELLGTDLVPRACFQDRFLREDVSLAALRRGMPQEIGDFFGADYKLESAESDGQGRCVVLCTRDGILQVGEQERLVRVVKRFIFNVDEPAVELRYELSNRSADSLAGRFAVELNLNLDAAPDALGLHLPGLPRRAVDEAGEAEELKKVALIDSRRRMGLQLNISRPARLWHYPIECVSRKGLGMRKSLQGCCLVLAWDFSLWGQEKLRVDLKLELRRG